MLVAALRAQGRKTWKEREEEAQPAEENETVSVEKSADEQGEEEKMDDMEAVLAGNEDDDDSSTDSAFGHHGITAERLQHGHSGLTLAEVASPDNASYMSAGSRPISLSSQPVSPMGLFGDVGDDQYQDEHPESFDPSGCPVACSPPQISTC